MQKSSALDQFERYGTLETETQREIDVSTPEQSNESSLPNSNYGWRIALLIIAILSMGIFAYIGTQPVTFQSALEMAKTKKTTTTTTTKTKTKHTSSISWTLNRKGYDPLTYFTSDASSFLKYKFLEHFDAVVEPNAAMHLYVEDYSAKEKYYYSFTVCKSNSTTSCKVGTLKTTSKKTLDYKSVTLDCEPFDTLDVTITKYSSEDVEKAQYTGKAICMYVRREIRDLTDDDLSATMDAMYALWGLSDDEGQKLYGSGFHNITYLLEMHHFNAAWPDADHFHEGNGFLAQHIKMTNVFENVIQLVDPSVTVPYWDYTLDTSDKLYPFQSEVMTADMFGSMRIPLESEYDDGYLYSKNNITDFAILDGRWAYIKAERNPAKFAGLEAGYGYMRSPWNMNPSPYVSRFTGTSFMPKCSTFVDMLDYTDLMSFMNNVEVSPHASVHGSNGGTYGCDLFDPLLEIGALTDEASKITVCKLWIFSLKSFYRKNLIHPQTGCSVPENVQDAFCPFECEPNSDDDVKEWLFHNVIKTSVPDVLTTEQENAWVDFMCGGDAARVFAGDHAESASPSDPSFWPIHPAIERLYQAKMMAGGFDTDDWFTDPQEESVCVRDKCYEAEIITGIETYDTWDFCCYGHFEDSQMLDFETGNLNSYWGPTNGETMKASDPTRIVYSMPYIYDGFTWDHCDDEVGGDMNARLKALYAKSQGDDDTADSTSHDKDDLVGSDLNTHDPNDREDVEDENDEDDQGVGFSQW